MTREAFKSKRWREEDLALVARINEVVREFASEGVAQATLRSYFYALVEDNTIPNTVAWYGKLGDIVSDARLCGLLDWNAVVDLGRRLQMPSEWRGVPDLLDSAVASYRLPRWAGQENYVEVWVEKEGMTVSIAPVTEKWHVALVPNKGYGSTTALYDGSKRLLAAQDEGMACTILYLGDHDPSGLDMDRDIRDRLRLFGVRDLDVRRVALTTEQVRRFRPPPNPAKLKDSRAPAYIEQFGRVSWEVNALSPGTLNEMLDREIARLVDADKMNAVIAREEAHKKKLRAFARRWKEGPA